MNKPDINPPIPIGRTLAETELLTKYLAAAKIGDVFTYQQMNEACKDDVQSRNSILQTARRTLMKPPHRMVFGTLVGIGIKRLSDEEIPEVGAHDAKRARNISRKGLRKLNCGDLDKMTQDTRYKAIATKTVLALFDSSGSRKVRLIAEQAARGADDGKLVIGDIAGLFKK